MRHIFEVDISAGETFKYVAVIRDEDEQIIDIQSSDQLVSMQLTIFDKANGVRINNRRNQDVLGTPSGHIYPGANDHSLEVDGVLVFHSVPNDTNSVTTKAKTFVCRYVYVYLDFDSRERTGIHEMEFTVKPLTLVL